MSQSPSSNPRLEAVRILLRVLPAKGAGSSLKANLSNERYQHWKGADRGLLFDLCFGVCRHFRLLDSWLETQMQKPLKASAQDVRLALCCGLYELHFSKRPAHAIVNAWPNICRKLKQPWASGLSNALLRKASRCDLNAWAESLPTPVGHSLPDWLYNMWLNDWPQQTQDIALASDTAAPLALRCNRLQQSRTDLIAAFKDKGIEVSEGTLTTDALYLQTAISVTEIPGFLTGSCSVQDEAAQLPASLFKLASGCHILDACAAPGGKTGQLCELYPQASIDAVELDASRLQRVAANLKRLGLTAKLIKGDAAAPKDWWDGSLYDAILLDAPCSATGILRRQPDGKWHKRAADVDQLAQLQKALLDAIWPLLKPAGVLVYATCSVLRQENDLQVASFLSRHDDAVETTPTATAAVATANGCQLLPKINGWDGFFFARLEKAKKQQ